MAAPPQARQLPLDLGHDVGRSRDDLVVTAANREAVALIDNWPDWPGTAVVLVGPPGSGKTHLAEAWRERSGAEATDPQRLGDPPGSNAVLVEDVDVPDLDEPGLFHLINALRGAGGHILMTASRLPATWTVALPDLASRLKAATVTELRAPDDPLLAAVVTKLFADRQVEIEPQVVQFLVMRMERSLAAAAELVDRLDRASMERKARITRALAADVLRTEDT